MNPWWFPVNSGLCSRESTGIYVHLQFSKTSKFRRFSTTIVPHKILCGFEGWDFMGIHSTMAWESMGSSWSRPAVKLSSQISMAKLQMPHDMETCLEPTIFFKVIWFHDSPEMEVTHKSWKMSPLVPNEITTGRTWKHIGFNSRPTWKLRVADVALNQSQTLETNLYI